MSAPDIIIKICRHGQSKQNTGELDLMKVGDHRIELTDIGKEQSRKVGRENADFLRYPGTVIYSSPYVRVRQTVDNVLIGAGLLLHGAERQMRVFEDPQLREVEHGYKSIDDQLFLRAIHGWFYYRYEGGESPADCYDRAASFIESMMRQISRKPEIRKVFIVTHGLTTRLLVMRFLHLTVEQFESLANPHNCDVITLAHIDKLSDPQFVKGKWGVMGLRFGEWYQPSIAAPGSAYSRSQAS